MEEKQLIQITRGSLGFKPRSIRLQSQQNINNPRGWMRLIYISASQEGFPGGSDDKESVCNGGDPGSVPGLGDLPEKGMATHSSILAWKIP